MIYLWKKGESPEINPYTNGAIFFTKEARIYNRAKTASSINDAGKTGQLHVFIGRTDAEAETPVLWPPHTKS